MPMAALRSPRLNDRAPGAREPAPALAEQALTRDVLARRDSFLEVVMPDQGKHLRCRDVGLDCDFEAHGSSEDEVVQQAAAHAKRDHGIQEITPDLATRVRAAIRSE